MDEQPRALPLAGEQVTVTGRLASMTREQAAELVRAHGGDWLATVTRVTSMLVVGQEGWPLDRNGRPSRKLLIARRQQRHRPLAILTEAEFLARLGLEGPGPGVGRLTTAHLAQVLGLAGERIRLWVQQGLLQPVESVHGIHYFGFRQVRWAKTLCDFARAGVSPGRIRRSLDQLKKWLPDLDEPQAQWTVLEQDGQLLVRRQQGPLAEPTGQGLLDFGDGLAPATVPVPPGRKTAEEWWQWGCEQEAAGHLAEAAQAYRQALRTGGPDAAACFNLANVLYAQGRRLQAAERYQQALEIDAAFVAAWNNLGTVQADLGEHEEAAAAFRKVLELDPGYADAHYNLADTLDQLGRAEEAVTHWQAYLRHDPASSWGAYARQRLTAERPPRASG